MLDRNDEVRHMAAFALGMLCHKDASSAEAVARSVLRIASLCNHSLWRIWAELQLTELVDEDALKSLSNICSTTRFQIPSGRNKSLRLRCATISALGRRLSRRTAPTI